MSTIKGAEYPLYKVLSSDFEFHIPDYQRPYAWTREQASELFDDISGFREAEGEGEKYFLGSIVLVKNDDDPKADVVDGQQRLTTLTLLLSAISSKLAEDPGWKGEFDGFVREPGAKALKLDPKPRLFLRERDRAFFAKYVQTPGRFQDLLVLDAAKLSEAQNYDFAEKKEKYFRSKSGVSPYVSTTQVLNYDKWTVGEVQARQRELLGVFRKGWQLG
jgi:hypothetical protein